MNIVIDRLSHSYPNGKKALSELSLCMDSGMFGLLGPNGAGKTTLMRILVTLIKPSSGTVTFGGLHLHKDRSAIRAILGYLPQDFKLFSPLKTWEFLDYVAALAGLNSGGLRRKAVDEMLEKVGLYEARNRQANRLSGGMKRRLGIAQALIGNPQIVIVDEPTTGLDPEERIRFRSLIATMSRKDIIIVFSTHIVSDISSACERLAVLRNGALAFQGTPSDLIDRARGHVWQLEVPHDGLEAVKQKFVVVSSIPSTNGWDVQVVADRLDGHTGTPIEPTLEHAYMHHMESRTLAAIEGGQA